MRVLNRSSHYKEFLLGSYTEHIKTNFQDLAIAMLSRNFAKLSRPRYSPILQPYLTRIYILRFFYFPSITGHCFTYCFFWASVNLMA
ncbi:hypothetical protein GYH30_005195 [Glycine max]|uniref:Uncharacterized protein n=1 Tax=Glycine max TaxID=3847 RepID=A0A0R0L850_SOYBN|nr:hypothetical protein GYH30_005195 [Glycine max]